MPAEAQPNSPQLQRWPCGPECRHAQPLRNSYGEWHWCIDPQIGGRVVRDGHECSHYQHASSPPDRTDPTHRTRL